jgi:hypothetical protein
MREFLKKGFPEYLEKRLLEPYFMVTERVIEEEHFPLRKDSVTTVSVPPERQGLQQGSLKLGGPKRLSREPVVCQTATAAIAVTSKEGEEEKDKDEEHFDPLDRYELLSEELRQQREQSSRQTGFFRDDSYYASFLDKLLPGLSTHVD